MDITSQEIINSARETLEIELGVLAQLRSVLDQAFSDVVSCLTNCQGRIIVTGVGKSALIARKIVATFNSTGSPAMFLHAGDAHHGDLGMVAEDDVVLAISKSGETAELKSLAAVLKQRETKLIALVSKKNSYLANIADLYIYVPVPREACPLELAPTSSTTAQLVLGDMLAICLMRLKGISKEHFAHNHPGGNLGKKLLLRVSDLRLKERPQVLRSASITTVISEISSKRLGATAVLDKDGIVCGIITDGDLRRMLETEQDYRHLQAEDIMTSSPKVIQDDILASTLLLRLHDWKVNQVLVLSQDRYLGMVHIHDLLAEGL